MGQTTSVTTTYFALDVQGLPEVIYTTEGNLYLHLPGVIMAESGTGEVRYLLSDGLGSVRQATDESGEVVAYNEFDPYGNPVQDDSSPYGFTGEWWERDVGLLHLRARWYAPETGTFLSRDAWEGDMRRSQSLNGWSYVEGSPINRRDPSGHCWGPMSFLRQVPYYDTTCSNLDMAIFIAGHPDASYYEKAQAVAYVEWAAVSHLVLAEALIIGGYGWFIEAGFTGGETYERERINKCFEPLPGEEPSPPLSGPQPLPTPLLPPGEVPQYPDEYFPDRPIPPHQLPEVPPGAPPQYPDEHLGPGREECRTLYFQYLRLLFAKNVAEAELEEARESGKPEWMLEIYRQSIRGFQEQLDEISRDYFVKGCVNIYGPLPDDTVPDDIPY